MASTPGRLLAVFVLVVSFSAAALEMYRPNIDQRLGQDLSLDVSVECDECVNNVDVLVRGIQLSPGRQPRPIPPIEFSAEQVRVATSATGRKSTTIEMRPVTNTPTPQTNQFYEVTSRVLISQDEIETQEIVTSFFQCDIVECVKITREIYWTRTGIARSLVDHSGTPIFEINLPALRAAGGMP